MQPHTIPFTQYSPTLFHANNIRLEDAQTRVYKRDLCVEEGGSVRLDGGSSYVDQKESRLAATSRLNWGEEKR